MANRIMKYSGIHWIGDIPKNWNVCKLSKICIKITDYVANGSFADLAKNVSYLDYPDYAMLIRTIDISQKRDNVKPIFIDKNAYQFLKKSNLYGGEIILPNIGAVGDVYLVPNIYSKMSLAPNLIMIKTNEYDKYYYYLFLSKSGRNMLLELSQSTAQAKFNKTNLKNLKIIVPSIVEQKLIADYLDNKCSEIDKLKEDLTKQIEILKEYKQSVITETVTKGLDSNVPMKDSGIDWIGDIPKNWKIKKGKYCLFYLQKTTKKNDEIITCFRDGEVTLRNRRREEGFTISTKEIGYQGIDKGDLVVHGMDGFAGAIGISDFRGKASPVLVVLDSLNNKRYLMYYLRSLAYNGVFLALSTGIRVRTCDTNWNKLKNIKYLLPPLEIQQNIVDYLNIKCAEIDKIISSKEEQLNTLEEYKKSLIYEYVTGKKEVSQES